MLLGLNLDHEWRILMLSAASNAIIRKLDHLFIARRAFRHLIFLDTLVSGLEWSASGPAYLLEVER